MYVWGWQIRRDARTEDGDIERGNYRSGAVAAPTAAPAAPPTTAPATGEPTVDPTTAPEAAPIAPPVRARSTGRSPHAAVSNPRPTTAAVIFSDWLIIDLSIRFNRVEPGVLSGASPAPT